MVIAKYISDLLFDYECVVIPGLGGFVTNERPATINYNTDYFTPPFKEVMFNPYLLANDGLLLNYIAKEEGITYQEAKHKVDTFVLACHQALNNGKRIRFNKIGVIYKDHNGKILFDQDDSVNYNPNSFGLTSFISPKIRKPSEEEKIKQVFSKPAKKETEEKAARSKRKDKKPQRKKEKEKVTMTVPAPKSPYRSQLIFVMLLVLAMMAGWAYMNKYKVAYYYDKYAAKIPLFYSNGGSYLANNAEMFPLNKIATTISDLWLVEQLKSLNWFEQSKTEEEKGNVSAASNDFVFTEKPEKEEPETFKESELEVKSAEEDDEILEPVGTDVMQEENAGPETTVESEKELLTEVENTSEESLEKPAVEKPKEETNVVKKQFRKSYYIIAGSFKDPRNAEIYMKKLRDEGFSAVIAGVNRYGMTRVAFGIYNSLDEAVQNLSLIREKGYPSAWVRRK